ncbi:MAG: galactonate dehydratase [Rhodobacteraceae bacterium]|mgnify:CR=1 FL=1|nr:galactonate dehydratase [Paracoccaceae bacterium]
MNAENKNWLFVKIYTDRGIYGWGEGSLEGQEKAVEQAIQIFGERIIGEDPRRIERLWQVLYRHGFWRGGIILNSALGAIDIALWDILGKFLGCPIYQLFGGQIRKKIRAYTHVKDAEHATKLKNSGFTALKAGGWPDQQYHLWDETTLRDHILSIQSVLGKSVDLIFENHGISSPSRAARQISSIDDLNLLWFEEPTPPDNLDALARVRENKFKTDLAAGERLFTRWGFRRLIERQLVDIIQPDVIHCGGLSEIRKIASMAETYYIKLAPHNPRGPIATAASLHLCSTIPNFLILEHLQSEPWFRKVQKEPIKIDSGYFEIPPKPGLGIDLDETVILSNPYKAITYKGAFYGDGGIADV